MEKVFNGIHELFDAAETGPLQGGPAQDAEPDFDLIEPLGVGRREINMGMSFDPMMIGLQFVNAEIIENEVDFLSLMAGRY